MASVTPFDLPAGSLRGRVAVVTGASRGLGAGLARRFADHGVVLGLCARTEPTPPPGVAAVCRSVDVADASAVDAFAEQVGEQLGPIDLWVNNAGVVEPIGAHRDLEPADVDRALRVNVGGVVNGARAFVRWSRPADQARKGDGDIARPDNMVRKVLVNITSGAARSVYEGWSIYGATKAAVDHFTEIVAVEEPGLVCHAVAPGVVDTAMQEVIRRQDQSTFPAVSRFRQIALEGAWNSPAWVADHLCGLLAATFLPDTVVVRLPAEPR